MIRWIEFYQRNFPCREPVLCHGDYGPEHIFVGADGRLTGIIDFGMFQGGPRVHDFALYQLNRTEQERIWLLAGYERLHGMEEDFEARLQLHILSLGLGFLAHETRIGNMVTAQNLAKRLRETFLWCQAYLGN